MKAALFKSRFALTLIFLIFINACNNDADQENFDVFADVFMVKKKIDGEILTANAYYVYSNYAIESVTVVPPENSNSPISLTAIDDWKLNYRHEPDSTEFNPTPPVSGNYIFEIENSSGEKIQKTDLLKVVNLTIPEIISATYNQTTLALTVKWQEITDTYGIFVKLADKEDNLLYISYALASSVTEFQIQTGDINWISSVSPGDELVLQIQSVVIEEDADENHSLYNIEGTAVAEKTITWGE